jgi:trimeric autotransporter adhesin
MGLFDSSDSSAQDYLKQALAAYQSAAVPTIASETVGQLPMETVQGTVNPSAIQVATQAPSAYNNISLDPATRAAQMAALSQYTDIANAGGLDPAAKLALQQTIDATNAQSQGAQGAIMNAAQAEGQGGGDFALTQRAIAAQGASNTGATQGLETAAMAEANRQAALNQMASIGSGVNASDYAQAQAKAAAQNQINATNQAATNTANTGNVTNAINAGEFNTNTAQGVNAANTAAGQNKVYYNAALPQQQFNNEITKASGVAGVSGAQANAAQSAQNANLGFTGSLLGAAGTIGGAALAGPAGAAAGKMAANAVAPQQKTTSNVAKGGYICYADGGVTHDHAICMKLGSYVPGKAKVEGDSEENDNVPAMLSPGELVIPRSVPKDGPHMEEFARNAPIPGTDKKVDLTGFTKNYKRSR